MRQTWIGIWTAVLFVAGILLVTWPVIDVFQTKEQTDQVILKLEKQMADADEEMLQHQSNLAKWYNLHMQTDGVSGTYESILNFGSGIMGYIEIPAIGVTEPIHHGGEDGALGVSHVPASSFPIGGRGNHIVLTGLGDISGLVYGDLIYIHILDEIHVYAVGEQQKGMNMDVCSLLGQNRTGQEMRIYSIRLDPELEEKAAATSSNAVDLRKAVKIAVAVALGVGMIPLFISVIHCRIQQSKGIEKSQL